MWLRWLTKPLVPALLAWGAVCLIVFYMLNGWLMPSFAGRFARTSEVPKLVGLKMEKAGEVLQQQGLSLMLDTVSDFSAEVGAGKIMSQFPDPGMTVKRGRRIWVRVSKGRRAVEVPVLRGMSQRQAEISLQERGLRLGGVHYLSTADVPAGAVVGTHPAAKAMVERGRWVEVDVSSGINPAATQMPSLAGLSLSQARNQIEALHLTVGTVTERPDSNSLPQTVLSQNPLPGAPLKGEPVDLVVSP